MITKGEYIVCGNKGVCMVEDITTVHMEGIDSQKLYYLLKPICSKTSTIYIAVNNEMPSMRKILTREEALSLIESLPTIGFLDITEERNGEAVYRESLHKNDIVELIKIIKTSYHRREDRISQGRKVVAVDEKYNKMACEYLFGELSVSLDVDKQEIEKQVLDIIIMEYNKGHKQSEE